MFAVAQLWCGRGDIALPEQAALFSLSDRAPVRRETNKKICDHCTHRSPAKNVLLRKRTRKTGDCQNNPLLSRIISANWPCLKKGWAIFRQWGSPIPRTTRGPPLAFSLAFKKTYRKGDYVVHGKWWFIFRRSVGYNLFVLNWDLLLIQIFI